MTSLLRKSFFRAVQSAVGWSLLSASLRVAAILVVLPVVLHNLPPAELGLWYVFQSIGGLSSLLDVGFNPTATRMAGYLWAGAEELQPLGLTVRPAPLNISPPNFRVLANLVETMRTYYRIVSAAILVLMLTGGSWWIWKKTAMLPNSASLRAAWIFFSFGSAYNTLSSLWPSLLSGINGVRQAQQIFAFSLVVNYIITVAGVELHLGIWSLVIAQCFMGAVVRMGGKWAFKTLTKEGFSSIKGILDWTLFRTLWPMAWRTALLSGGAFLVLNANTLVCSWYLGLAETASYGLTLQVIGLLISVSSVWVDVKIPLINQLRTSHHLQKVAEIFVTRIRYSMLVYLIGSLAIILFGQSVLALIHAKTGIIPSPLLIVFLGIYFLEFHHTCYANLILSENENPFILPSLISGFAVLLISILLTPHLGLWGIVLSFGGVQLAFSNWWTVWRGIKGLGMKNKLYWQLFFCLKADHNRI